LIAYAVEQVADLTGMAAEEFFSAGTASPAVALEYELIREAGERVLQDLEQSALSKIVGLLEGYVQSWAEHIVDNFVNRVAGVLENEVESYLPKFQLVAGFQRDHALLEGAGVAVADFWSMQ